MYLSSFGDKPTCVRRRGMKRRKNGNLSRDETCEAYRPSWRSRYGTHSIPARIWKDSDGATASPRFHLLGATIALSLPMSRPQPLEFSSTGCTIHDISMQLEPCGPGRHTNSSWASSGMLTRAWSHMPTAAARHAVDDGHRWEGIAAAKDQERGVVSISGDTYVRNDMSQTR